MQQSAAVLRLPLSSSRPVALRFPGQGMHATVPSDTRIEMLADAPGQDAVVVYVVGRVSFAIREAVVPPESVLGVELRSAMSAGVSADGSVKVVRSYESYDPYLFPILFDYLNRRFESKATATINTDGLSDEDKRTADALIRDFMLIDAPPVTSTLDAIRGGNGGTVRVLKADGIISRRLDVVSSIHCRIESKLIHCFSGCGDTRVWINTELIPTSPPWPKSLVAVSTMMRMPAGEAQSKKRAREEEEEESAPDDGGLQLPAILCDELSSSPTADGEGIPPYPYPVDFERTFFVPARAIRCIFGDGRTAACEGVFDRERNTVRIDALDVRQYGWFYLQLQLAV